MADSELVKDIMVPAVQLEANETAGKALQTMRMRNVIFGVISGMDGKPLGIVTREHISAADADELVQTLPASPPHPKPIESQDTLDSIVQTWANDFEPYQYFTGIVVQEQGKIEGILLRETIEERVLDLLNMGRLSGSHIGSSLYRCKQCHLYPKCPGVRVKYYDPKKPPQCPQNKHRPMDLVSM